MASTPHTYRHVHEVPARPVSMHALSCLRGMAEALERTGPAFATTFYNGPPVNAYDPILTVVVDRQGHRFTTEAAGDGESAPAAEGHSAHNTFERSAMLAPLKAPARLLHAAVLALPALCGQHTHAGGPTTLLRLSFHLDEKTRPFFHLQLAGASYGANLHSRTPDELVEVEAWRFHVLAHGPVWDIDAPVRLWTMDDDNGVVTAPDSGQARLVFAAKCSSRSRASAVLFTPLLVPLWTRNDGVECTRLVHNLFANTA